MKDESMIKTCEICGGQYATSLDDVYTEAGCKCSELQRENNRYREALKWIVSQEHLFFAECSQAEAIVERCRQALETPKSTQDPILDHFDDPNIPYRDDPYYKLTDDERKSVEQHFRERGHDV